MEPIIAPVSIELLKAELTSRRRLRGTNKSGNEIYVIDSHNAPNVMREIGRLREEAFRDSGGGSGRSMDIDEFDTMETPYQQLIVWDPDSEKILGGYRFVLGNEVKLDEKGQPVMTSSHMFHFSEKFIKEYLPYTIELGRAFVAPEYQSGKAGKKALFALDNLWDGIGALAIEFPHMKYFFGKVTIYPSYDKEARDLILHFLHKHFEDKEKLVEPIEPIKITTSSKYLESVLNEPEFKDDYKLLNAEVRSKGVNIPPLVNAYMSLSSTMKMFGSGIYHDFGGTTEACIMIAFDEIHEAKKERHINSFIKEKIQYISQRFPIFFKNMGTTLPQMIADKRGEVQAKIKARQEKVRTRRRK